MLHFKAEGELVNNLYLQYNIKPASKVLVKTQYAGVEVHMAIVKLLCYLSTAYFKTFHLDDEGHYWATGDEAVLHQRFAAYNTMLDAVCGALQEFETKPNEPVDTLADRLDAFLRYAYKRSKTTHLNPGATFVAPHKKLWRTGKNCLANGQKLLKPVGMIYEVTWQKS